MSASSRCLRVLPGDGEPLPKHLAALKQSLQSKDAGECLKPAQVQKALQADFGLGLEKYVRDVLAPLLIQSGLLRLEQCKWLGLIPYTRYARTAQGEERIARLLRLFEEAGGMRRLIRTDPDRALKLAQAAGVLLLLSPQARSQLPKLKKMLAERLNGDAGGGGSEYSHSTADEPASDWDLGVEMSDFGFTCDAAGLFDGMSAVGDFGGGDGGGGDGGGGGD